MANPFVYVQLHTQQPEAAKKFYGDLFDWNFDDLSTAFGTYTEVLVGEGIGGGIMKGGANAPTHWLPFVDVNDVAQSTDRARALGATVIVEPSLVPGKGTFSVIIDPTGATLALWQKAL
ncbi:MAG: Glyoxalase/bleomycin resistance protein/dioxygenase [Chlorobi bacterium]|nr:Glyoxalase/bleomycin resistance protein/dioxygenase [Chlorobiota bacterium]